MAAQPAAARPAATSAAASPTEPLSLTGRRWRWPQRRLGPANANAAAAPAWLRELLLQRGISGEVATARFLAPSLRHLDDPAALRGMAPAVARILAARTRGEKVWIYGDYDVDGVCATATLVRFFAAAGVDADYYVPHRQKEGYGLNGGAIATLAARGGLLVTVDCGSTSYAELEQARAAGLDVVVVDHHKVQAPLPEVAALINPQRPDCGFANQVLCAAGLAFLLVVSLRRALREADPQARGASFDVRGLLDLVAVATVADVVPLTGINRTLLHAGLHRLRTAPCVGLGALCEVARVNLNELDASSLGFRLGPRINARGRMDHAGLAVDLMLCDDPERARQMAEQLDAANEARRAVEKTTLAEAVAEVEAMAAACPNGLDATHALVVHHPGWHAGVLGLVASRLVQRYFRPAVVIGEGGKGSARGVPGLDLVAALGACAAHLVRHGGHAAAAGLTAEPDEVPALRRALDAQVHAALGPGPYVPALAPVFEADLAVLDHALYASLHALGPFGRDNAEILLAAAKQRVLSSRVVGDGHLKLRLGPKGAGASLDAIAFGLGHLQPTLPAELDVLFYLERNAFRGQVSLQARVVDLRPAQPR